MAEKSAGREETYRLKREHTRAVILAAARQVLASAASKPITVDQLVEKAGVAKGTFYLYFNDLTEIEEIVGGELLMELDQSCRTSRADVPDPLHRLATALALLLNTLALDPQRARLLVRASITLKLTDLAIRGKLNAELAECAEAGRLPPQDLTLATDIVFGICLQMVRVIAEGRLRPGDVARATATMLGALGVAPAQATEIADRAAAVTVSERCLQAGAACVASPSAH